MRHPHKSYKDRNVMGIKLGRDDRQSILQVSGYVTKGASGSVNIISGGSRISPNNEILRLVAIEGDAWISIDVDAGSGQGLYLPEGSEITMTSKANITIHVNDAQVNITPLGE